MILPLCLSSIPSRRVAWYAPILLDFRQHGLGCRDCLVVMLFGLVPSRINGAFRWVRTVTEGQLVRRSPPQELFQMGPDSGSRYR